MPDKAPENQWYVRTKNGASGPYNSQQIKDFAANGKLPRTAHLSKSPDGPWTVAENAKGLFPTSIETDEELKAADFVPDAVKNSAMAISNVVGGLSKSILETAKTVQSQIAVPEADSAGNLSRIDAAKTIFKSFCNDGQDYGVIQKMHSKVSEFLVSGESILYMAVQSKPIANLSPDSVVLTNKRFIIFRTKLLGQVQFFDCSWKKCGDVHMKENILGAEISFTTKEGHKETIDYLPKPQARQLYRLAQEQEDEAIETRRNMQLEELQAGADKTVINQAIGAIPQQASQPVDDVVARMAKLKSLMSNGLISQEEFEAKKQQILDSI